VLRAMFAWQFQKALHVAEKHGWTRFVSMQDHLNLLYREEEREMLPLCRDQGVAIIPYSPLASGRLTRAWSSEQTRRSESDQVARSKYDTTADADRPAVTRVAEVADRYGVPRVHIALAWLLQKKPVTAPIIRAERGIRHRAIRMKRIHEVGHVNEDAGDDLRQTTQVREAFGLEVAVGGGHVTTQHGQIAARARPWDRHVPGLRAARWWSAVADYGRGISRRSRGTGVRTMLRVHGPPALYGGMVGCGRT
jgi:Aldo/keto reductase family